MATDERRSTGKKPSRQEYTAFDRALVKAKDADKPVYFIMADGRRYVGHICSVDKYFIEIDDTFSNNMGGLVWIQKVMITSARIDSSGGER